MEVAYERMAKAEAAPAALLLEYLASKAGARGAQQQQEAAVPEVPEVRVLGCPSWDPTRRVPTVSVLHARLPSRAVCEALRGDRAALAALQALAALRDHHPDRPHQRSTSSSSSSGSSGGSSSDSGGGVGDSGGAHGDCNDGPLSGQHIRHDRHHDRLHRSLRLGEQEQQEEEQGGGLAGREGGHRIVCRHGSFLAPRLLEALGVPPSTSDHPTGGGSGGDNGVLRFSLVHYNTVSDVRRLIAALEDIGF